jgi:hypothetical protein
MRNRANNKTVAPFLSGMLIQRVELVCGILLTLTAIFFHLTFMRNAGAFWRDEMVSIADIWNHIKHDSMPELLSVVLRLWIWVATDSQFSLRLFGFLVGIATLGVLWLNGRLLGYRVPLLSVALFVFNPISINVGDSVRPYGLGILLILLTIGLLWKVTEQGRPWQIIAATVTAIMSVQCIYQNALFLTAAIFAGVVVSVRNRLWKRTSVLIAIGAIAAASMIPYVPVIRSAWDWMIILKLSHSFSYSYILQGLAAAVRFEGPLAAWIWGGSSLLAIGVLFYSQRPQLRKERQNTHADRILFCGTVGVVCTIMLLLFLKYMKINITPWYYLPLMAISVLSLDGVLGNSNIRNIIVRIAVAMLAGTAAFGTAWQSAHMSLTNMDKIAVVLESLAQKDDLIIVNPYYIAMSFQKYYHGQTRFTTIPPLERYDAEFPEFYDVIKTQMMSANPIQPVLSDVAKALQSGHRIWIVGEMNFSHINVPPPALPPAPNSPYGWYLGAYMKNWNQQVVYFIQSHSKQSLVLKSVTDKPVFPFEKCDVTQIYGWQQ